MIAELLLICSLSIHDTIAWTHGVSSSVCCSRRAFPFLQAGASSLLYEEHEKMLVQRGQLERELMEGNAMPIEADVVKGAGSGGGFGAKGNTKSQLNAQGKAHAKTLRKQGVVRIDSVLPGKLADDIRAHVYKLRASAEEQVRNGEVEPQDVFADVLLRENRCDLTIPLGSELVADALVSILGKSPVGSTIESLLGKDAVLYELSSLMSDPGSNRQVMHPDTPCSQGSEPVLYTCFVALQDIHVDMGPTTWMPMSHNPETHELFQDETGPKDELLRTRPCVVGLLKKGSCAIFDSRVLHCGGANESDQSRALFYCTFKNPKVLNAGNPGSIRRDLISKYTLSSLRDEIKKYEKGKPSDLLVET